MTIKIPGIADTVPGEFVKVSGYPVPRETRYASDLEWLTERCVSVHLECNAHRDYHQTAAQAFLDAQGSHLAESCSAEVRAECEMRDIILHLHVYPDTPIGFYRATHYDMATLLREMREAVGERKA